MQCIRLEISDIVCSRAHVIAPLAFAPAHRIAPSRVLQAYSSSFAGVLAAIRMDLPSDSPLRGAQGQVCSSGDGQVKACKGHSDDVTVACIHPGAKNGVGVQTECNYPARGMDVHP